MVVAFVLTACDGETKHSGSPSVAQSGAAGAGGAVGVATAGVGGSAGSGVAGVGDGDGGAAQAGASPELAGSGGRGGESAGGNASGGSVTLGGGSNQAGTTSSAGAQTDGGAGWLIPAEPGAGWNGPQDPACPEAAVARNAACTSPPGTRCSYPESGDYTLRCQCYTSSTGDDLWWCQDHASIGYDLCPVAYPGNGSCPNIGDVTCYYVGSDDKLEACNCFFGALKCQPWGL
jgi:hypothetical protein